MNDELIHFCKRNGLRELQKEAETIVLMDHLDPTGPVHSVSAINGPCLMACWYRLTNDTILTHAWSGLSRYLERNYVHARH